MAQDLQSKSLADDLGRAKGQAVKGPSRANVKAAEGKANDMK